MPRIFDNINDVLHPALVDTMKVSTRADFCVGYFNLRGWRLIESIVEGWEGTEESRCRLLVGMQRLPADDLRAALRVSGEPEIDQQNALRLKRQVAEEFREQLIIGAPSNGVEASLRRLSAQLRSRKVVLKLFLRHTLHAKLYLLHREDPVNPMTGYVGSSNLTFAGLAHQGELNVDVVDLDAAQKLHRWFDDRWEDRWCIDISEELADLIDQSWASAEPILPYEIYLKMAYHLSREARAGLAEFDVPKEVSDQLLDFQSAAVKIAAHHVDRRNGVLIGDVVGLGKTVMASALARLLQENGSDPLILCPKSLVKMWEDYRHRFGLKGRVLSLTNVIAELPDLQRYRVVIIDESHNLRNREGKRYRVIQDYIERNESRCVLLSATPYNKTYLDLSAQLRLFVPPDLDLGIRPEQAIKAIGESEFIRRHQCGLRTLAAFEFSEHPDDWRELMRLYLVRRTRSFIESNYTDVDPESGRRFLTFGDGGRYFFPRRVPRTIRFEVNEDDNQDQYAKLYSQAVIRQVNRLHLPRYGLGNYVATGAAHQPTPDEKQFLDGLSRSGQRLMGFSRTNLFKRLESGGPAFLQSLQRHVMRNCVYIHALSQGVALPIGTQDLAVLDSRVGDQDPDSDVATLLDADVEHDGQTLPSSTPGSWTLDDYLTRAEGVYDAYATRYKRRFRWIDGSLFVDDLQLHLRRDAEALIGLLKKFGDWDSDKDSKLAGLVDLLTRQHPDEKVLVFSQFADTVDYLVKELKARGVDRIEGVTGASSDPTELAWRFSPGSNQKLAFQGTSQELQRLITTDVLSEGQNLQDASIVVNFDLPWAIIGAAQGLVDISYGTRVVSGRMIRCPRGSLRSSSVMSSRWPAGRTRFWPRCASISTSRSRRCSDGWPRPTSTTGSVMV